MVKHIVIILLLLVTGCSAFPDAQQSVLPTPTVPPLTYEKKVPFGVIQVLESPEIVPAGEAAGHITSNDLIMGMDINGEQRAYPIGLMRRYEIANDVLGGEAIAVTFCPSCNTGLAFSRMVDGQAYVFDFSGMTLDNAMVMKDRESQTLWSQVRLQGVEGTMAGTRLELLASNQMTWQEWSTQFPNSTLVIDPRAPSKATAVVPVMPSGPRVDPEAYHGYVAGIAREDTAMAFPLDEVVKQGVVNSEISGLPIVLVGLGEPGAVAVWDRRVNDQTLTFTWQGDQLIDEETKSVWDTETGLAESGEFAGMELLPIDIWVCDWRGWLDAYPMTTLELVS